MVPGSLNASHTLQGGRVSLEFRLEHFAVRLNALQRIATFVSQPRAHPPDRRQPFGLQGSSLRLLQFGDVVSNRQNADRPTLRIAQDLVGPTDLTELTLARHDRRDGSRRHSLLQHLPQQASKGFAFLRRHKSFKPRLPGHVLQGITRQLSKVWVEANNVAFRVEDQHDRLSVFQQAFGKLAFLMQHRFEASPLSALLPSHMFGFIRVFDQRLVHVDQFVQRGNMEDQVVLSLRPRVNHRFDQPRPQTPQSQSDIDLRHSDFDMAPTDAPAAVDVFGSELERKEFFQPAAKGHLESLDLAGAVQDGCRGGIAQQVLVEGYNDPIERRLHKRR